MTAYYVSLDLTPAESTRRFVSKPLPGTNPPQWAIRECHQEGHYKAVIRRHGEPGWTFRFTSLDRDVDLILGALNTWAADEVAA